LHSCGNAVARLNFATAWFQPLHSKLAVASGRISTPHKKQIDTLEATIAKDGCFLSAMANCHKRIISKLYDCTILASRAVSPLLDAV